MSNYEETIRWKCPKGHVVVWRSPVGMSRVDKTFCDKCNEAYQSSSGIYLKDGVGRDPLLVERQKTHGDFARNAEISQRLKGVAKDFGYKDLCPIHREAFEMIALKLSRILSGQANFKDHWNDIAGYAKLGAEACQ